MLRVALTLLVFLSSLDVCAAEPLVVGVPGEYPPDYIGTDEYASVGFALSCIERVADAAGYTVVLRRFSDRQSALAALQRGVVQAVPLVPVTEETRRAARLTAVINTVPLRVFTRTSATDLQHIEDLSGRRVSVLADDPGYAIALELGGVIIRRAGNVEQMLFMLLSGNVDAIIHPDAPILYYAEKMMVRHRLRMLPDTLMDVPYAMAVGHATAGGGVTDAMFERLDRQVRLFTQSKGFERLHAEWYSAPAPHDVWVVFRVWGVGAGLMLVLIAGGVILIRRRSNRVQTTAVQSLLDGYDGAALLVSPQGRVVCSNGDARNLQGYVAVAANEMQFSGLFPSQVRQRRMLALERVLRSGETVESLHEENSRLFRMVMRPVLLRKGASEHVLVLLRDSTEKVRHEEELRELRRLSGLVFDRSPEGVGLLRQDMTFSAANRALRNFLGRQDDLEGVSLREILHAEDAEDIRIALHRLLSGEAETVRLEKRFRHKSGVPVWGVLAVTAHRTESGVLTDVVVHVVDVNERRAAEARFRDCELRYRHLMRSISDMVLYVDMATGRIEDCNVAATDALGELVDASVPLGLWHRAGIVAQSVEPILSGTHMQENGGPLSISRGRNTEAGNGVVAVTLHRRDGTTQGADARVMPLPQAVRQYAFVIMHPVSGHSGGVQQVDAVHRTNWEYVVQAVSRELYTPLRGMLGVLQLLHDSMTEGVVSSYLRSAMESGSMYLRLLEDLVVLRGYAEHADAHVSARAGGSGGRAPFVLDDMLRVVINSLSSQVALRGIVLRADIAPELPEIMVGEAVLLRQTLFCLVSGAVSHAEDGEIRLHVREPEQSAEEGAPGRATEFALVVRCADDGAWKRITQQGTRPDEVEGDNPPVTVLKTIRHMALRMGGDVRVTETPYMVILHVPLLWNPARKDESLMRTLVAEAVAATEEHTGHRHATGKNVSGGDDGAERYAPGCDADDVPAYTATSGMPVMFEPEGLLRKSHGSAALKGRQILVADDDTINRMVVGRWLEMLGCSVLYAENGRQVLRLLAEAPGNAQVDAIVMDVQMPEMNGIEATRAIRAGESGERNAQVPVLALTAIALAENRNSCLEAGMNEFLTKPLDMGNLVSALHRFFGTSKPGAAHSDTPDSGGDALPVTAVSDSGLSSFGEAADESNTHEDAKPSPMPETGQRRR